MNKKPQLADRQAPKPDPQPGSPSRRAAAVDGLPSFSHATNAEADRCVSGARQVPSGGTGTEPVPPGGLGQCGWAELTLVATARFTSPRVVVRTHRGRKRPWSRTRKSGALVANSPCGEAGSQPGGEAPPAGGCDLSGGRMPTHPPRSEGLFSSAADELY